jgi:hypothetical protein
MKTSSLLMILALALGGRSLSAQQPGQPAPDSSRWMTMRDDMQAHARMMDSTTTVLDSLVDRMNRASGNAKVTAMAQVINTLVAERKAMRSYMRQMMQAHGGRMRGKMRGDHMMRQAPRDSVHSQSQ